MIELIQDLLIHIQTLPSSMLCSQQEWEALRMVRKAPIVEKIPMMSVPVVQKVIAKAPPPAPPPAPLKPIVQSRPCENPIKAQLTRLVPHLKLTEEIPDDSKAQRIMNGWREYLGGIEVVLLVADRDEKTLALVKNLAKSIDQKLAKVKVLGVERLEKEQKWDLLLEKNKLRLIIATKGFESLTHRIAEKVPIVLLFSPEFYTPQEKTILWNNLCQILKP